MPTQNTNFSMTTKSKKFNFATAGWKSLLLAIILLGVSCKDRPTPAQQSESPAPSATETGFIPIFNGESLDGWEGDENFWRTEDGQLIGEITPDKLLKNNTFLIWKNEKPADFELKLEFWISEAGNSGINYRSERLDSIPFALRGYQADMDGRKNYTGQNYEERKRATLAYIGEKASVTTQANPETPGSLGANIKNNAWQNREVLESLGDADSLRALIKSEDWNECHLIIKGNRLQHYINGTLISEVIDNDQVNGKTSGYLGLQLHVGPPMIVRFKNIQLKNL